MTPGRAGRGTGGAKGGQGRGRTRTDATAARAPPPEGPPPELRAPITGWDRSRRGRRPLRAHRHLSTRPLGPGRKAAVVRPSLPWLFAYLGATSRGRAANHWRVVRAVQGARRGGHRVASVGIARVASCQCAEGTPTSAVPPTSVHRLQTVPRGFAGPG